MPTGPEKNISADQLILQMKDQMIEFYKGEMKVKNEQIHRYIELLNKCTDRIGQLVEQNMKLKIQAAEYEKALHFLLDERQKSKEGEENELTEESTSSPSETPVGP